MIGSTIIYEFHEMCCPYHIAAVHVDEKLTDEQLHEKLFQLIGFPLDETDIERYVSIIDHNRLRGLTILGEEIPKEIIYDLEKFFPESLTNMESDEAFGNFSFKFTESKAAEYVWRNRHKKAIDSFIQDHILELRINAEVLRTARAKLREQQEGTE